MTKTMLLPGDPAPRFRAAALGGRADYVFDSAAGRPIVMLFLGSGGWSPGADALRLIARRRAIFDDRRAAFFGVTIDRTDVGAQRIAQSLPGVRWFLDFDLAVSRAYGAVHAGENPRYEPHWLLLDARLRVVERLPIARGEALFAALDRLIGEDREAAPAPVLVVPRVLDKATCDALIAAHRADGGTESGFMREEDGITVLRVDRDFKRRTDCHVLEGDLRKSVEAQLKRFLFPQIRLAYQFEVTRVERWLVGCYDDRDGGGFFRPHRDNTTKGTAHRKFACTINLNAEEYEGGDRPSRNSADGPIGRRPGVPRYSPARCSTRRCR